MSSSVVDPTAPVVLVVDDESLLRWLVSDHLSACGYNILEAADVNRAIHILESGVRVDLVFSDIRMPGDRDGFWLARWVREHRSGLPVFLTSGDSNKMDAAAQLCEQEPFFAKPYDLDDLAMRIDEILRGQSPMPPR